MSLTRKQISGNQRRSLRALRQKVLDMAAEWDGLDQFCFHRLEELADEVERASIDITIEDVAVEDDDGPL